MKQTICFLFFSFLFCVSLFGQRSRNAVTALDKKKNDGDKIDSVKTEPCKFAVANLDTAMDSERVLVIDSLFAEFCDKCKNDTVTYKSRLKKMVVYYRNNGYQIKEVTRLQGIIDSLPDKSYSSSDRTSRFTVTRYFTLGINASSNVSSMGPPGNSYGIEFCELPFADDRGRWGFGIGASVRKFPFSFTKTDNKFDYDKYKETGYLVEAKGYNEFVDMHFFVYRNPYMFGDEKTLFGLWGGLVVSYMNKTYLNQIYYEYAYTSSTTPINESIMSNTVTYISTKRSNYEDRRFFKNDLYGSLVLGANMFWKVSPGFWLTFCPYYSYSITKVETNFGDYRHKLSHGSLKISGSFVLYSVEKEKQKRTGKYKTRSLPIK